GPPPAPCSLFRNPDLAAVYRRIVAEAEAAGPDREAQIEAARDAWYRGFVAEAIDAFCRSTPVFDSSRRRHHGLLTADDMARWRARVEAPLTYDYHGVTVCKTGPWGQGPVFLQQLALLKGFDLAAMDPLGAEFVHTVTECAKLAFADREAFYGDPDFVDVPVGRLLSDAYNDERRALVGERASKRLRPGRIAGFGGPVIVPRPGASELPGDSFDGIGVGEPTLARPAPSHGHETPVPGDPAAPGDTCHLDVIDRHGNMVSATPSGGWLQSSPVVPGLGFCLTNRGQMFWLDPRSPSALAPGKRPRTTLTPSLALKDGRGWMAFGTPGGDQQDQWSLVFFLRHLHHGLNLQAAIDAPMFHTEHMPSSFYPRLAEPGSLLLEGRFAKDVVRALRRRGHRVAVGEPWSLGRLSAAKRENGVLKTGANPRGMQGYAVGR
ncbi:MAG: gamma-glutamyltransferase, partial [Rhodospirillaceae bacterium]|nr:gamma-glutamyltransferase [Rhodospirillaceae bacterium]